jgi:hypothetical protein
MISAFFMGIVKMNGHVKPPKKNKNSFVFAVNRTIDISLFFLLAGIPLIINPTAFDYWYKPKADSLYALIVIIIAAAGIDKIFIKNSLKAFSKNIIPAPLKRDKLQRRIHKMLKLLDSRFHGSDKS